MSNSQCKFVLQGPTGGGKSELAKLLHAQIKIFEGARPLRGGFEPSSNPESKTMAIVTKNTKSFSIDDCPGINDTHGFDDDHFKKLIISLKTYPFSVVLFVISAHAKRLDVNLQKRMAMIVQNLGSDVLKHFAFVATSFYFNDCAPQRNLMKQMLCQVYQLYGKPPPSDSMLDSRLFCLDCDPEKTSRSLESPFSPNTVRKFIERRDIECDRILFFGNDLQPFVFEHPPEHKVETYLYGNMVPTCRLPTISQPQTMKKRPHGAFEPPHAKKHAPANLVARLFANQSLQKAIVHQPVAKMLTPEQQAIRAFFTHYSVKLQKDGFIVCKELTAKLIPFKAKYSQLPGRNNEAHFREYFADDIQSQSIQKLKKASKCIICCKLRKVKVMEGHNWKNFCSCHQCKSQSTTVWIGVSANFL